MVEVPETGLEIPSINQLAVVVENLDDAMATYHSLLGVGPWDVYRSEPPDLTDTTYHGESHEYGMVLAFADAGAIQIELIEPTIGPNIYEDHLEDRGEGFHHVAYFSEDESEIHRMNETLSEAGIPVMQSGNLLGTDFWYFDTRELLNGLVFETGVLRDIDDRVPDDVYPER